MIEVWLLGTYILGTVIGVGIGNARGVKRGQVSLMTTLIHDGYVKAKKNAEGDLVLIKLEENQL